MTNFSRRLGLVSLGASLFVGGCWVAPEPLPHDPDGNGGWGGKGGYGGGYAGSAGKSGHSGSGGYGGGGGYSGTGGYGGGGGYAGTGGYGGTGGDGGDGGTGGKAGMGGGYDPPLGDDFTLTGGDIDEDREVFPFGVAIGPDGAVFVSTLGNRDNEPSRIYRFAPGSTSDPEVLFQVGNAEAAAVYGLTFDDRGRLYACLSQHLDFPDAGTVVPSLFVFEPTQLNPGPNGPLGQHDVRQSQLRAGAVNYDGFFVVDQVEAGGCGAIAYDGDATIYVPDTSGASNYVFRYNAEGIMHQPGGQIGDAVTDQDLEALIMTAWFGDDLLGGGDRFGVTGVAVADQRLAFVREGEGGALFQLGVEGLHPAPALDLAGINADDDPVTPFGLAPVGSGRFVLSSRDADQLLLLQPTGPDYQAVVLFDRNDANEFVAPAGIAVRGEDIVVVASHFNQLGAVQDHLAKAFRVQKP